MDEEIIGPGKASPGHVRKLIVAILLAADLLVLALAAYSLLQSRQQHELRAQTLAQNMTQSVDYSVSRSIEKIDLALTAIADELQRELRANKRIDPQEMKSMLAGYQERLPDVDAIRIADAGGRMLLGKGVDSRDGTSLADREYFTYLRDHPDAGMQVSPPIMGRVSKKYVVLFARRYNHADGSFAGSVFATIALDYFTELLSRFNVGSNASVVIRDADLGLIARYPAVKGPAGEVGHRGVSKELQELVRTGVTEATYFTHSTSDRMERTVSVRRIKHAPMMVFVGVAKMDYLAEWYVEAKKTAAAVLVFVLLSIVSGWIVLRLQARIVRESARNRLYLHHASDGIHVLDGQGRLLQASDRFCAMLGYRRDEMIGMAVGQWDADGATAEALKEILPQSPQRTPSSGFETRHRRKDGTLMDVEVNVTRFEMEGKNYLFASSRDIGERKRQREELALAASVFSQAHEGIVICDANEVILNFNPTFSDITGYERDEIIGKTPRFLSSGQHDGDFYGAMWQSITEAGHWSGEIVNRHKSGALVTERLSITRVDDAHGNPANYIGIFSDLTEAKNAKRQIEQLSYFDALTGLPNRMQLSQRLEALLMEHDGRDRLIGLLTVSIGGLSHVNDSLGHHYGDKLLLAISQRLEQSLPADVHIYRHTGNGFAVIHAAGTQPDEVGELARHLLELLHQPFHLDRHPVAVSPHIGISLYPKDGQDPASLLKNADVALHCAKSEGGNGYEFFRADMNEAAMERMLIETRLRQALQQGELSVHYQPQVDLASGRVTGMEALVRWSHPEMGMVSPARFIPVAETSGLIIELGNWVLREACRAAQSMRSNGHPGLKVAVNVSARQFANEQFAEQVQAALAESGLPPECLELELTESLIMKRPQQVVRVMEALKSIGITFSVDDFGTGYSSFSQLTRFPIDKLKIDRSFIHDITTSNGPVVVRAIIALSHSLHLEVIAEGVETEDQLRFLKSSGCHSIQGYLFSHPLPEEAMAGLLERSAGLPAPGECFDASI